MRKDSTCVQANAAIFGGVKKSRCNWNGVRAVPLSIVVFVVDGLVGKSSSTVTVHKIRFSIDDGGGP